MKLFVDGCQFDPYSYDIGIKFEKLDDYKYKITPINPEDDFSTVEFSQYLTGFAVNYYIGIHYVPFTGFGIRGYIDSKSNSEIVVYLNTNDDEINNCIVGWGTSILKDHSVMVRNYVRDEIDGFADSSHFIGGYSGYGWLRDNIRDYSCASICIGLDIRILVSTYFYDGYPPISDANCVLSGQNFWDNNIGIVSVQGDNIDINYSDMYPEWITRLEIVCKVSAGNFPDGAHCSYGKDLDFYLYDNGGVTAECVATPRVAAMFYKLMTNHENWNFQDARQALRQTATNWESGFVEEGGFGEVNYTSANAVADADLFSMSPLRQSITINTDSVDFTWLNSPQSIFSKTIIAKFDTEPERDTTPTSAQIIYEGELETFTYQNYGASDTVYFAFMTKNNEGNYSKIESYDKHEKSINISKNRRMMFSDVRSPLVNRWN